MKRILSPFNWRKELENMADADTIDDDLILFDKPVISSISDHPFRLDVVVAVICKKGSMSGSINLQPYKAQSPSLIILTPGQILQHENISEDFSGHFILMTEQFTSNLFTNVKETLPLFLSVQNNPTISLTSKEFESMEFYYTIMQRVARMKDNPHRMEIVRHITLAFFYGLSYLFHKSAESEKKTKHEVLVEKYINLVKVHYKEQRSLDFYADKLCLTPKYLSKIIKENSGKSANNWIENHVLLDAKALLKSTNMTIQQISDELNFPSQSFFGKYFKRHVGVSPKEYRKN